MSLQSENEIKAAESARREKMKCYPFEEIRTEEGWFHVRIVDVEEQRGAGQYHQKLTTESGAVLRVIWSTKANGIQRYDVIDCQVRLVDSEIPLYDIVKSTLRGASVGAESRPVNVTLIEGGKARIWPFHSIRAAYNTLLPPCSYSTLCRRTRQAETQADVDAAFERSNIFTSTK